MAGFHSPAPGSVASAGGSNTSSVTEYDPSGNVVQSIPDTSFDSFTSVALMPDGRLVINIEYAKRIEIRTGTGALINSFIPQGAVGVGWDVDVFADDTIAVCARDYGVKLYDTLGNLVDTFLPTGMVYPFGCQVAIDDSLLGPTPAEPCSVDPGLSLVCSVKRTSSVPSAGR